MWVGNWFLGGILQIGSSLPNLFESLKVGVISGYCLLEVMRRKVFQVPIYPILFF